MLKNKLSIVCVYNDFEKLQRMLISTPSIEEFDLVLGDNTKNKYKSAASALNELATLSKNEYILFAHQDFYFKDSNWIAEIEKYIDKLPNSILGFAGKYKGRPIYSNTITNNRHIKSYFLIEKEQEVVSLDECAIIISKKLFFETKFNEELCNGWHLYVAELCMRMSLKGIKSFVIPTVSFHESLGIPVYKGFGTGLNVYFSDLYRVMKFYNLYTLNLTTGTYFFRPIILCRALLFIKSSVISFLNRL